MLDLILITQYRNDEPKNKNFYKKIEKVQYNVALSIAAAIKEILQTKLSNELCFESLKFRRWMRRLCMFYKNKAFKIPEYLLNLIPNDCGTYKNWKLDFAEAYLCRTDAFKFSFFPFLFLKENKLNPDLRSAKSYSSSRKHLLTSSWPNPFHLYKIHDPLRLTLLTRLRLGLSDLNKYRLIITFTVLSILRVLAALK